MTTLNAPQPAHKADMNGASAPKCICGADWAVEGWHTPTCDEYQERGGMSPEDTLVRVACRAWNHGFAKGREYEELDTLEAMRRVGEFTPGEGIDIAAIVALALESKS